MIIHCSPAYAGIDRLIGCPSPISDWFPRIRGDRPCLEWPEYVIEGVPPHTRG